MKKQFNLQDWLKDKSQKVETRDGRPARIICTDAKADDGACIIALIPGYGGEEAYQFFPDGRAFSSKSSDEDCADLFLVTPEPELSEFEKKLSDVFGYAISMSVSDPQKPTDEFVREYAPELLAIARKELYTTIKRELEENPNGWVQRVEDAHNSGLKAGYKNGRAEALKDLPRWKKENSFETEGTFIGLKGKECFVVKDGYSVPVTELLTKLPGFKEDEE